MEIPARADDGFGDLLSLRLGGDAGSAAHLDRLECTVGYLLFLKV